jgi:hypothetical protein
MKSVLWMVSCFCFSFPLGSSCEAAENEKRREYLELRDINYDFAQKYREYLEHRASRNHKKSREAAKAFKKRLNSYLLRLPSTQALQDPNGYYSSPLRFGFNPLLWKPINNLYSSKPFLVSDGSPGAFTEVNQGSAHPIDFDSNPELPQESDSSPDKIKSFSDRGLGLDLSNPLNEAPTDSSPSAFSDQEENPLSSIASADELDLPADPASRFPRAIHRYSRGTEILGDGLTTLEHWLEKTQGLIATGNPDLKTLQAHRLKIEEGLQKLQHIDGILSRFNHRLSKLAEANDLDTTDLREPTRIHSELHRELLENVAAFEDLIKLLGNPYDHVPDDRIEQSFDGAAQSLANPTLSPNPNLMILPASRLQIQPGQIQPRQAQPTKPRKSKKRIPIKRRIRTGLQDLSRKSLEAGKLKAPPQRESTDDSNSYQLPVGNP